MTGRIWVCLECEEETHNKKEGGINDLGCQTKSWDCQSGCGVSLLEAEAGLLRTS